VAPFDCHDFDTITQTDDHPHFLAHARELAAVLKHTIFVDQVNYSFSETPDILALLEEHITGNLVKASIISERNTT
jgi:hypothetical protein